MDESEVDQMLFKLVAEGITARERHRALLAFLDAKFGTEAEMPSQIIEELARERIQNLLTAIKDKDPVMAELLLNEIQNE
jgi:hypothetical protein